MRILRVVAIAGLLAAATACGSSDNTSPPVETDPAPVVTTTESPVVTTEPEATTTEPTAPDVTSPADSTPSTTTSPASSTTPSTTPAPSTVPALVDVKLYLLRDEQLAIAHRDVAGPAVLRGALVELLAGPTSDERAAGLGSEIPSGTELLDVALAEGLATVDLSADFESGGGSLSMTARVAQVVFTATQFDNVDQVLFMMEGTPIEFLGGEGIVLDGPQTRSTVERSLTGGVIVDTPAPGDIVSSPFVVTGEGDVFEAGFPIEIWADGVLIVRTIAFAGAWGDWDEFEAVITLVAAAGPIELIAYDASGCGEGPECPPTIRTVIPLDFAG